VDKVQVIEQLSEITMYISTTEPGLSSIGISGDLGKAASLMLLLVKHSLVHGKVISSFYLLKASRSDECYTACWVCELRRRAFFKVRN
jgi:hypothetical protein